MVLDVLQQEHLVASAASVGSYLLELLTKLQHKHEYIGGSRPYTAFSIQANGDVLGPLVMKEKKKRNIRYYFNPLGNFSIL